MPAPPRGGCAGALFRARPRDFLSPVRRWLPGRANHRLAVQPFSQKYSGVLFTQITSTSTSSRPHKRGVSRSSRTLRRDAVDAGSATDESAYLRTAKSCGPDAPTLASSFVERSAQAMVANKPGHQGE